MANNTQLMAELQNYMNARKPLIIDQIDVAEVAMKAVNSALGLKKGEIKSKKRDNSSAEARFIFCHLLKRNTTLTLREIGTHVCRDHTSVYYSINAFERLLSIKDKSFIHKVRLVEEKLGGAICI